MFHTADKKENLIVSQPLIIRTSSSIHILNFWRALCNRDIYAHVVVAFCTMPSSSFQNQTAEKNCFPFDFAWCCAVLCFSFPRFADITEMFIQMTEHVLTHNAIDVIDFKSSHTEQRARKTQLNNFHVRTKNSEFECLRSFHLMISIVNQANDVRQGMLTMHLSPMTYDECRFHNGKWQWEMAEFENW